jgi:hypothetical protein
MWLLIRERQRNQVLRLNAGEAAPGHPLYKPGRPVEMEAVPAELAAARQVTEIDGERVSRSDSSPLSTKGYT